MESPFPPFRAPTHQALAPELLSRLARAVAEHTQGNPELSLDAVSEIAKAEGVPPSQVVLAAPFAGVTVRTGHDVSFEVCAMNCQAYGSAECVDTLLELRSTRLAENKPAFDIRAVGCMNGCMHGPLCRVVTPAGVGFVPMANAERLRDAVDQVSE